MFILQFSVNLRRIRTLIEVAINFELNVFIFLVILFINPDGG